MEFHFFFGIVILLEFLVLPCELRKFRFAMALDGVNWDFGYTFHQNLARISLQKHLDNKYPDIDSGHVFQFVPPSWSPDCDPQLEQWIKSGIDLIITTGLGHQFCASRLATLYPNVTFISLAGFIPGPPNYANIFVRFYQMTYLIGSLAARMTQKKKVCVSACVPAPMPVLDVSGFARGVHETDASVEIHILGTGQLRAPLLEVWNVNQSYALGCDIVWVQSLATDGIEQASTLGMMSIGFFTDGRLTVGESVITSGVVDFAPLYIRTVDAVLNGSFATETKRADWWMGWEWGGMYLGEPSFLVPKNVTDKVMALTANLSRIFCGRVCTKAGCLCNSSSCCLTDAQLGSFTAYPDFAIDHGILQLPGLACQAGQFATWHLDTFTMECAQCPAGTVAFNQDEVSECRRCPATTYSPSGSTVCITCPAGTYSNQPGSVSCTVCPAGSIAANPGASACNVCPSGISNDARTECGQASLGWLAGVGGGVGALLLLVGAWGWWASRKMRRMRKQFSNDNVAIECAGAIARLDLQAVAWLNGIPNPNCIQLSFIRIVKILEEVRKYVPDQLLQSLAHGETEEEEGRGEGEAVVEEEDAVSVATSPKSRRSRLSINPRLVMPLVGSGTGLKGHSRPSIQHRGSRLGSMSHEAQGLFTVKKVTYMEVRFNLNQHQSTAAQAEANMKAFLSFLIDTVKAHGGTMGHVLYDHAIVHWGTGKRAVSEAPMKAVEMALALTTFSHRLLGNAQLALNVAIGSGNTISGVLETATSHFFMVGGGQVPLVQRIAGKDCRSTLGAQILITDTVRACVQYSVLCHPRLVDGDNILWEPLHKTGEKVEDEWMYQLKDAEHSTPSDTTLLAGPFVALRQQDYTKAEALLKEVRQQCTDLHANDLAALAILASAVQSRTNRCL